MVNGTYLINQIPLRFIKYQVYSDNNTVRLLTSARAFNVAFDDMPEVLRHWIPLTDNEGVQAYDHIAAELGVKPVQDNPNLLPQKPITVAEAFESQFLEFMKDTGADSKNMLERLNELVINLKDIKNVDGALGQAYTNKAKQMINAINTWKKIKEFNLELFQEARKIFGLEDGEQSPPKSSNQDRSDKLLNE